MDNDRVMNVNYCIMLVRNGRGRVMSSARSGELGKGEGKKRRKKREKEETEINVRKIGRATAFPFKYCN